jgi:hypothetical protein
MNVNWEKKCIFLCHPFTGEKDIAEYFGKIGFTRHYFSNNSEDKNLDRRKHSNRFLFPWTYDDFKLIVSVDNPYRRIVNEYKRFSHINWDLKSKTNQELFERFNQKFKEMFVDDLFMVDRLNRDKEGVYNFLLPYDFSQKSPDYIIRLENLVEDINKIDILDHVTHDFHLVDQLDISDKFKDVFSYEHARVIYKTHKNIFDLMGYDPFSFTTKDLSHKERVHFIHY